MGLPSTILTVTEEVTDDFVGKVFGPIANTVSTPLWAAVTLFVVVYGYMVMTGHIQHLYQTAFRTILLVGIATISLVVGGIGIMNIMLVAVSERTHEIGVRMAVGARRRDVLLQFLVEAVVVSFAGGIAGVGFGYVAASLIARFGGWDTIVPPYSVVLALGALSAVGGVVYALFQHDLKRLLALHSIENVGIIVLGIGACLLLRNRGADEWAAFALAAALLHTLNHAVFKSLLFLGAGAVLHATHTRNMEEMGGLIKRMPQTALFFLIGAVAISALPPLNGFVSEWLTYQALLQGFGTTESLWRLMFPLSGAMLALTGAALVLCRLLLNSKLGLYPFRSGLSFSAIDMGWLNALLAIEVPEPQVQNIDWPPNWLGDARFAMPALAFMSLWGVGHTVVIYLAGLRLALRAPRVAPMTVTISLLVNSLGANWQVLTAAAFISVILPLLVFFTLQRYFVRGILAGSVKG